MKKLFVYFILCTSFCVNAYALDTIRIDSIGIKETIFEYKNFKQMRQGLMYDTLSIKAGEAGNVVVLGHRYSDIKGRKPNTLIDLPKVNIGEVITITKSNGTEISYKVFDTFVVSPFDDWVTYDYEGQHDTLTLYTCSPLWDNSFRYVVKAKKVAYNDKSTSTISEISDKEIRASVSYSHKNNYKKAIFNETTGVEPKVLFVNKGEDYQVLEANKKNYKAKIYKNREVGEYNITGKNGSILKVVVE